LANFIALYASRNKVGYFLKTSYNLIKKTFAMYCNI